jgi:hypothetical protein
MQRRLGELGTTYQDVPMTFVVSQHDDCCGHDSDARSRSSSASRRSIRSCAPSQLGRNHTREVACTSDGDRVGSRGVVQQASLGVEPESIVGALVMRTPASTCAGRRTHPHAHQAIDHLVPHRQAVSRRRRRAGRSPLSTDRP